MPIGDATRKVWFFCCHFALESGKLCYLPCCHLFRICFNPNMLCELNFVDVPWDLFQLLYALNKLIQVFHEVFLYISAKLLFCAKHTCGAIHIDEEDLVFPSLPYLECSWRFTATTTFLWKSLIDIMEKMIQRGQKMQWRTPHALLHPCWQLYNFIWQQLWPLACFY